MYRVFFVYRFLVPPFFLLIVREAFRPRIEPPGLWVVLWVGLWVGLWPEQKLLWRERLELRYIQLGGAGQRTPPQHVARAFAHSLIS